MGHCEAPESGPAWRPCATTFVALACLVATAHGQTVVSNPASQVHTSGHVFALVRQADGKIVVGGEFVAVNGVPRNNLARLNPDGSLDNTWDPDVDGAVFALAIDGVNIYAGGGFNNAGGNFHRNLARFAQAGDGTSDPVWDPSPDAGVFALALDGAGSVYVGGLFTTIGGQPRNYLAKLSVSGSGTTDALWNPSPDARIGRLALSGGFVFTVGAFTTIGGQARQRLAKLDMASGLADPLWAPTTDGNVFALTTDVAGNVYLGGDFAHVGASAIHCLARIPGNGAGQMDPAWTPSIPFCPYSFATEGSTLYVGGYGLARISSGGLVDSTWTPAPSDLPFYALVTDGSANVTGGGLFSRIGNQTRLGLASFTGPTGVLAPGGPADPPWAIGTEHVPQVDTIAVDSIGGTIIGGAFQFMHDGTRRNNIARLNADGSVDTVWDPNPDGYVSHVATDGNANVFVGGFFHGIGGAGIPYVAKIPANGNGAADPNWNPAPDDIVESLAVDASNVYVAGWFKNIGGQSRNYLAKVPIAGSGAADAAWNPNPDSVPWRLTLDGATLYAGGTFTTIGGQPRINLARLSTSGVGAADPVWAPNPDRDVWSIAVDAQGDVFTVGNFAYIGGQARLGIAKLSGTGVGAVDTNWGNNIQGLGYITLACDGGTLFAGGFGGMQRISTATGAIDPAWHADPDYYVSSLLPMPEGNVHVGGIFTRIADHERFGYALLAPYAIDVASPLNPSTLGDTVTFVATLSGSIGSPTGSVTFKSDTLPINGCVAVPMSGTGPTPCSTNALSAGDHAISVEYSSDPGFGVASSAALVQTVDKLASSTTIATSANPSNVGAAVTFTATVTATEPSGSAAFAADGVTIAGCGAVPLVMSYDIGTAQCSTAALATGTHAIAATYSGDSNNAGSSSPLLYQAVDNADGSSVNVALAVRGSVATASSTFSAGYPASAINDGDRAGLNIGAGGVWRDATPSVFPDWVQIDFPAPQTIDRVVVYSVQDNASSPVDPSDALTFSRRGITAFDVQSWNGVGWVALASVVGNNLVKRNVSFAPTTTKTIRVTVNAALGGVPAYSLITEVEAWLPKGTPPPPPPGTTLASSANPGRVNQGVTFTATVVGSNPSGIVAFSVRGSPVVGCASVPLAGAGNSKSAACTTTFPAKGTYPVVARFGGDGINPVSTSVPLPEVIKRK